MRVEGWEERLGVLIQKNRETPFEYGVFDCLTWAFECHSAITGADLARLWRGKYKTAAGAQRVIKRYGCHSMHDVACALLGAPLASPLMAQRGDIVLELPFGVCIGHEALFAGDKGLDVMPMTKILHAWRI